MSGDRRFSGAMGDEYDLFTRAYPKYGEMHALLAEIAAVKEPAPGKGRVRGLEIGCGSGITTSWVLGARDDIVLRALDTEPKMIEKIKESLSSQVLSGRLEVVEEDALAHLESAPDGAFDLIVSGFTLHNLKSAYRSRVLAQIYRCLDKGGLFLNADKYAPDDDEERFEGLGAQLERFFDAFVPMGKIDLLKEWVLHNVADQGPGRVMKEGRSLAEMRDLGFVDVGVLYRHGLEAVVKAEKKE